jgi:hypothetical protein
MFQKLDSVPAPGEGVEIPTVLGPVGANLNHWTSEHQTMDEVKKHSDPKY